MSKFTSKIQLLDEITKERLKLEELLDDIPTNRKEEVVSDGMSVKDFLAHRMHWGKMMIGWYEDAVAGKKPAVPSKKYKWNQLKELNQDIFNKYKDAPLKTIDCEFVSVHNKLYELIYAMSEDELFSKKYYDFTGSSDLATYLNSATASHYRSARRIIQRWWKAEKNSQ